MSGEIAQKVELLRPAYLTLQQCARLLKEYLLDTRASHWCIVPTLHSEHRESDDYQPTIDEWIALADTLTLMRMDSEKRHQHAGVLVSDDAQLHSLVDHFNQAKAAFKSSVWSINPKPQEETTERTLFNEWLLKSRRDASFTRVLNLIGAKELNLAAAYRDVRVTAPDVTRYSYTWDKHRRRSRVISRQTVGRLIAHIADKNPVQAEYYQQELRSVVSRSPRLLHITQNNPVLRANISFAPIDGQRPPRQLIIATGITLIPQSEVPAIVWRPKPSERELQEGNRHAKDRFDERYKPVIAELGVYYDRTSLQ